MQTYIFDVPAGVYTVHGANLGKVRYSLGNMVAFVRNGGGFMDMADWPHILYDGGMISIEAGPDSLFAIFKDDEKWATEQDTAYAMPVQDCTGSVAMFTPVRGQRFSAIKAREGYWAAIIAASNMEAA